MAEYTVSSVKLAETFNTSDATIRNWTDRFAEFLSEKTRPAGEGSPRAYTEEDTRVLATVALMRQQNKRYNDIEEFLADGQRLEWPTPIGEEAAQEAARAATQETAVIVATFQTALATYENRLDKAQQRLEEEQAARLAAEIRAARAETELEILKQQREEKSEPRRSFWQRVRGE